MDDQKPDKALLDQSIEAAKKAVNIQPSDEMSSAKEPGNTVYVKSEPVEEREINRTGANGALDDDSNSNAQLSLHMGTIKTEPPFLFADDTINSAPGTSGFIQSFQDIPGPSSTPGDTMMKLEEMDNIMKASDLLRDMADKCEPGPSTSAAAMPGPSMIEVEQQQLREMSRSLFHIDTSQIQGASSAQQSNDLAGLGVSVYNQDEFEAGVMQQVDQAINLEEEKAAKQRAEKDMKAVITDIRSCKQDISRMDRLIQAVKLPSAKNFAKKEAHRKMLSIKTQRENKVKQLKNLRAKQRTLMMKINGSIEGFEVSDDDEQDSMGAPDEGDAGILKGLLQAGATMSKQETERERMIRLGEMTPFGTTMSFANTTSRRALPRQPQHMTDFERAMLAKDDVDMNKHKESTKATKKAKKRRLEREKQYLMRKKEEAILAKKKKLQEKSVRDKPSAKGKSKKPVTGVQKKKRKTLSSSSKEPSYPNKAQPSPNKAQPSPNKATKSDNDTFEDGTFFAYKPMSSESSEFPRRGPKRKMGYGADLRPNWGSDEEMSGDDVMGDDSDEYRPDERELMSDEEDGDYEPDEVVTPRGRVKGRQKKRNLAEDIEDGTIASLDDLKAAYGVKVRKSKGYNFAIKKSKDDSSQDQYFKRLRENKKKRLVRQQKRIERGEVDTSDSEEEEDMEFDGGLTIPGSIWTKLYRYQKTGVKWMWELHQQQCGGIVGDEMGLGKTIQMIAFLAGLKKSKLRSRGTRYTGLGPVIIVCPTTVMHQWVKEFHKWAPDFRVAILHDSGAHTGTRSALVKDIAISHAVIVTSYSSVRLRQDILLNHDWHYVILDEGHTIRNPDARVTLACKQFRTPHRLILSGSPMQNNLRELWSLFDFVFPGKLGTLPVFMEKFSVPITIGGYSNASSVQVQTAYKCACVLRDTINPYLLRRMKSDVRSTLNLPEKNEQVLFCHLTDEQTAVYKEYLEGKECQLILHKQFQVFAGLIKLRKICNHPDLVSGGPRLLISESADDALLPAHLHYGYWKRSGKMIVVESLLKLWHEQGHRVLLFSQSKQMLDILERSMKDRYTYMRMDGGTPISSRQTLINKFNYDTSIFLFLLTTRVGGLGVNLTGANRVVIFDPDWNPSTDTQARERAWRIGQRKQVTIYRLLTTGTIEEKIYHRQIFKTFLSNRVLKDPRQRRFFKSNDMFELFSLGSSADTHGTETSAIFAGTGSDVRVKMTNVKRPPSMSRDSNQRPGVQPRSQEAGGKGGQPARPHPKAKASKVKRSSSIGTKLSKQERDNKTRTPSKVKASKERQSLSSELAKLSDEGDCEEIQVVDDTNENEAVERTLPESPHLEMTTSGVRRLSSETPSRPSEQEGDDDVLLVKKNNEGAIESDVPKNDDSAIHEDTTDESMQTVTETDGAKIDDQSRPNRTMLDKETNNDGTPASLQKDSSSTLASPDVKASLAERARQIARKLSNKDDGAPSPNPLKDSPSALSSPDLKASLAERARQIAKQLVTKSKDGGITTAGHRDKNGVRRVSEGSHSVGKGGGEARGKKKKKKKRKHDATIDGHRIANLAKHSAYKGIGADDDEEVKKANAQADDYVLQKLFKKSGVHSALQHDNIMNSANPDYVLVENEADRVAKEAVKALKQSRQRCMTAASGVPTWTGASGHSGAPPGIKKPRFGQKSNSRITPGAVKTTPPPPAVAAAASAAATAAPSSKPSPIKGRFGKKKQHFQGDEAGTVTSLSSTSSGTSSPALPASTDLLSKMRARNHIVLDINNANSDDDDENNPGAVASGSGEVTDELLKDIHQFVSFQAEVDGQAMTSELLAKFKGRLPSNSTALFKSMLTKICDFHRKSGGEGIWKLKPEFR